MKNFFGIALSALILPSAFVWAESPDVVGEFSTSSLLPKRSSAQLPIPWFGEIDFQAVATGIGMVQTNPAPGDYNSLVDVANAQVILKKDAGLIQFYFQGGFYSTPSLGSTYQRSAIQTKDAFGMVPLVSISFAPSERWLFTGGKINSFGGYESTFTFQNANIDRGLLWNQTSNVSKGFQATYKEGAASTAVTFNDGFYSNQLSWMGASFNCQLDEKSNASLVWAGAIKPNSANTFITPIVQNNSQIFNAIYTYESGKWSITPYLQYTYIPANSSLGILTSAQTSGAAILTNYRVLNNDSGSVSLPLRFEYISSTGKGNSNSPNLLYGPGSAAWSATVTPTYQFKRVFMRGEFSYVQSINATTGLAFGSTGSAKNQSRAMIEIGIWY